MDWPFRRFDKKTLDKRFANIMPRANPMTLPERCRNERFFRGSSMKKVNVARRHPPKSPPAPERGCVKRATAK